MKGHTQDGKFHPHMQYKKEIRKSRDIVEKEKGVKIESGVRKKSALEEPNTLDKQVIKLQESFKKGLDKHDWKLSRLKNAVWDIDISYEGSHGTVDTEYFTITAFRKGVGSVSYTEAFSNDDWFDPDDTKRAKKIETDSEFAEKEYEKWLGDTLELYEDAMFEGLVTTIEDEYKE